MTGEIEVSRDGFFEMRFCGLSLRNEGVLGIGRLQSSPSFADMNNFFVESGSYAEGDIG